MYGWMDGWMDGNMEIMLSLSCVFETIIMLFEEKGALYIIIS